MLPYFVVIYVHTRTHTGGLAERNILVWVHVIFTCFLTVL
jgi:hypothetical protein